MSRIRICDVAEQIRGVSYKPTDIHTDLNDNSVILLRANNIADGKINFDDVVYVDKSKVYKKQYLKKGDILICASSGSKQLVGKAASVNFDLECTFGAFCKVVRPNEKFADYLGVYFQSDIYRRRISELSMGANINNIKNEHIDLLDIPFCDETTTCKFVQSISKLQEIIDNRKQQLQQLDDLVKARFVEMFGDPVSNQHGFKKVSLSDLADIRIGPFGSLLHKEDYIEGGHALLNPSHIIDGNIVPDNKLTISAQKYEELSAYHLKIGDVVMGRRGEMGRCAVVTGDGYLCGTGSLLIRTKGEVTADYIQKVISFPSFKKTIEDMAVGQTMPNLNVPIVSNFQIIKPPIEVQKSYYAFVEQIDKSKAAVQKALDETQTLFDSLMQEYFG